MGFFDRVFSFSAPAIRRTGAQGALTSDIAIAQYARFMTNFTDPDAVLKAAGITRKHLIQLESDDEVYQALDTRRGAVVKTPWRLEHAENDGGKFIWDELTPVMDDLLRGTWGAVPYGYSVIELIYAKRGGRIGLERVEARPFHWFIPTPDHRLLWAPETGFQQLDVLTQYPFKFVLTRRNATYENPAGEALLSRCYWPWFFRHNSWKYWMQFLERFGEPLIIGKNVTPADFVKAMTDMGFKSVLGVDGQGDIEAIYHSSSGEFDRVDNALMRRIQRLILGQTLTSDVDGKGSYAAAKVHNEVRGDKRADDLRLIQKSMQRVVDWLHVLNRFPGKAPEFCIEDPNGLETDRAERDAKLVQSGTVKLTEQYLLRTYDFEKGDFEIPQGAQNPAPGANPDGSPDGSSSPSVKKKGQLRAAGFSGEPRFTPQQEAVEAVGDSAIEEAGADQPVSPEEIRAAINAASDPGDLANRLAILFKGKNFEEYRAALEKAMYAASILGFVHSAAGGNTRMSAEFKPTRKTITFSKNEKGETRAIVEAE